MLPFPLERSSFLLCCFNHSLSLACLVLSCPSCLLLSSSLLQPSFKPLLFFHFYFYFHFFSFHLYFHFYFYFPSTLILPTCFLAALTVSSWSYLPIISRIATFSCSFASCAAILMRYLSTLIQRKKKRG